MPSLLPIVATADNFPPFPGPYPLAHPSTGERYVPFHLSASDHTRGLAPLGLLRPAVVAALAGDAAFEAVARADGVKAVAFAPAVLGRGREALEDVMDVTARQWKAAGMFSAALDGWRDEKYTIYADPRSAGLGAAGDAAERAGPRSNAAFACERAACAVWGFATFGVHMTAYEGEGADMKIWVPRRSATKATWPSKLDNTVAGGIADGYTVHDTMVKECEEEASLPAAFVAARLKSVGACSYFYITDDGFLQPEVEYIYDLPLPPRGSADYVVPRPNDDEVEAFALLSVPETLATLHAGEFKPNCGLILVDFFIRHGLVSAADEPAYLEIAARTHRPTCVATPM
ncbi:hypothetical protein Q5752_006620 [Cryptotrichosporon argae]